jgi:putative membrane-bound dehydrogenase-like protein
LGTEIVRRDEVRLIEDTDGDGYASKATVFAAQFNSVQGLAYHDGTLYVMHAPLLTALRDTDGDGKADERRDLLSGLGLPPEQNATRLHGANGVVAGHDGWLYLALGDHGCNVQRPEGDRLVLEGGGILRCRPDGRDLHVFAAGLRNIYDVALDADLNVFVRDNENDGGTYMIRVCHSFFGADHGYPYLYYEHPDEALPPLADLGLGSSAGGLCYLECQFPKEYRSNLFFCEWGRSVVRYRPERSGGSFAPLKEIEFASGAANDPYGFKPTDLVVDQEGSLFVADWADGQQPKRGRGRVYRIGTAGPSPSPCGHAPSRSDADGWIARLQSESSYQRIEAQEALERLGRKGVQVVLAAMREGRINVRGRLHAVWLVARIGGPAAADELFNLAQRDPAPRVQAQAVRALADLIDPVFLKHRLGAGPGDAQLAQRLATWAVGKDPRVLLEVIITLGRLRWPDIPGWLPKAWRESDAALAHAAMQALRRSGNWPAVLKLIDRPDSDTFCALVLRALAGQYVPEVVDGLINRLGTERDASRRWQYAQLLTRVYKQPGPWIYWGYRPPPRPVNTVAWERSETIRQALNEALGDSPDRVLRVKVLGQMQREKIPVELRVLGRWLREEEDSNRLATILASLREHPANLTRDLLGSVVRERKKPLASRLSALDILAKGLDATSERRLLEVASALEDGAVLAEAIRQLKHPTLNGALGGLDPVPTEAYRQLGKESELTPSALVLGKLESSDAGVRAAAVEALARLQVPGAARRVHRLMADKDIAVRRAAAAAAGKLGVRAAVPTLLKLARDSDVPIRRSSLESLRLLKEPRAAALASTALDDPETRPVALQLIAELGGPDQANSVVELARRDPAADVLPVVLRLLTDWGRRPSANRAALDHSAANLQGISGVLARWRATGPLPPNSVARLVNSLAKPSDKPNEDKLSWQTSFATETDSRVRLAAAQTAGSGVWLAYVDVNIAERVNVEFLGGGTGGLRVWLNGRLVWTRDQVRPFRADSERFEAVLEKGLNRVVVGLSAVATSVEFQLHFRRKSSTAMHEQLTQAALSRAGNPEHGRKVFFDAAKSQCVKCHRIGDQGERIGPDLTGIGTRFPRIHLIESLLQPSRTIAPGYQAVTVVLKDGRLFTGVTVAETDETLTLGDTKANKQVLRKADIEEQRPQSVSVMPEGLEKQLTVDEFVDLIAFLADLKGTRHP